MKIAFIFPGQGSQSLGMLSDLYQNFNYVQEIFTLAHDTLGYNLWNITQNDKEKLNQTCYTQVAMLCAGIACLQVLECETDITPDIIAGHSLGEITALVAAGVITFVDSIKIVNQRAKLMQEAVPVGIGSMAAILGLEDNVIIKVCQDYSDFGIVEAVNFNANGQVVIAGNKEAVALTCIRLKALGAKRALILPVSVPAHSSLMADTGVKFLDFLADFNFNKPKVEVLHNVNAQSSNNIDTIKTSIAAQLYNPVLWVKTIKTITNFGVSRIIEVGPGKVLSGLNKRIDKNIIAKTIFNQTTLEELKNA